MAAASAVAAPALGQEHVHAAAAKSAPHKPVFSPVQDAVLDRLSDIIIPSDEQSPGAHEAGVSQFLVQSVSARDYFVLQAYVVVVAAWMIITSQTCHFLLRRLDPRLA